MWNTEGLNIGEGKTTYYRLHATCDLRPTTYCLLPTTCSCFLLLQQLDYNYNYYCYCYYYYYYYYYD